MTDICLGFEVHQPFRLRNNLFWDSLEMQPVPRGGLFNYYFNASSDREIFNRAAEKCYTPSNLIILNEIDRFKHEKHRFKLAFSLSGIWLEQCENWNIDLLDTFKQLGRTGCVEFLDQPYYHSISSLWPDRSEWIEQVQMHRRKMAELLGVTPSFFENTEFLYNNAIAKVAEEIGYKGIFTEGVDRVLEWRSPNYVYKPKGCEDLRLLVRNYRLTDDFGFRFSARWWPGWPLTADKFASWLSATPGQCINLFADYETFGEHHWRESGILEFLRHLPEEVLNHDNLDFATPSEIVEKHQPVGEIDVSELGRTISWADIERDTSCWLGNTLQWSYYEAVRRLEQLVRESQDEEFLRIWRYFQISDLLYYMFVGGGGPGEVHSYFSPYGSPYDAFVTCITAILDFGFRLKEKTIAGLYPFTFHASTIEEARSVQSLLGFLNAIKNLKFEILEFHLRRGDFSLWFERSLLDPELSETVKELENLQRDDTRSKLLEEVEKRYQNLVKDQRLEAKLPREDIAPTPPRVETARRILRRIPSWKAFWFYQGLGNEVGLEASSLSEFSERLKQVSEASIEFHAKRGDFEMWIRDAVHDTELAEKVGEVCRKGLIPEYTRQRLIYLTKNRIEELLRAVIPYSRNGF